MVSKIKKFKEAYASTTVAVYEPLVLKWISEWGLLEMASINAERTPIAEMIKLKNRPISTALASRRTEGAIDSPSEDGNLPPETSPSPINGPHPRLASRVVNSASVRNLSQPSPLENTSLSSTIEPPTGSEFENTLPTFALSSLPEELPTPNLEQARDALLEQLILAAEESFKSEAKPLGQCIEEIQTLKKLPTFNFLPLRGVEEVLSPIGIANFYRQLYYYVDEGYGPIEQCFSVAPKEKLTVVVSTSRRQIQEEVIEFGSQTVSEQASEEKNQFEVSDKVSSMLQRDLSTSMSVSGSYSVAVFQASAQASFSMSTSQTRGRETATRRLKDVTKRASERITKSYSVSTRNYEEFSESEETTHVFSNEEDKPVSYALRRIFNRLKVQVQDLGPKLVWQLHIRDPGRGLFTSKFVHYIEADEMLPQENLPLNIPPKPKGGVETGQAQVALLKQDQKHYAQIKLKEVSGRKIVLLQIDSMQDVSEQGGKEKNISPAPYQNSVKGKWNPEMREYTAKIRVRPGNSEAISINYTYRWEPDEEALENWEAQKKSATFENEAKERAEEFERKKALITERSKISPRPANELRREERYEVLNRMISHLFGNTQNPSLPNPKEIEFFHRFFDVDALFVYNHPSWWKPNKRQLNAQSHYPVTADSEPAKLGSSLGWKLQLDGDNRRNEFLNSAWVRVCLPLKPGREEEAIEWLSTHVEGKRGFNLEEGPLADLVKDIKKRRKQETELGQGEDYVNVDHAIHNPITEEIKAENIYPVVDEFEVTVPTEGFIYDKIEI